jgi:hypothetical protein
MRERLKRNERRLTPRISNAGPVTIAVKQIIGRPNIMIMESLNPESAG